MFQRNLKNRYLSVAFDVSAGNERAKTALSSGLPLPPSVEVYFVWECEDKGGGGSRKTGVSRHRVTAGQQTCQWLECKHWAPDFLGGVCICICSLSAFNQRTHNWRAALHCISLMKGGWGGRKWEGAGRPGWEGGGERREVLFEISCSAPAPTVCR